MPIIIHHFDRSSADYWVQEAKKHWKNKEHVISFICAWIAFNYCYSLFWSNLLGQVSGRRNKPLFPCLFGFDCWQDTEGYVPDHVQIATFINNGRENLEFEPIWESFVARHRVSLVKKIGLPVLHLETDTPVPDSTPREVRLVDLEDRAPLFQVIVTIRNNLFHGGKRFTTDRSVKVCSCAAEFMVPFVTELIDNIEE